MEQTQLPNVAVIIANHNYGQYVCDAITSASLQDYPAKAVFVVDDASTDNSIERIYKTFLTDGSLPTLLQDNEIYTLEVLRGSLSCDLYLFKLKKNGGPSRARNVAIQTALQNNFHIVAILDADDIWREGKLSKSVAEIIKDPESIGGVYTDYYLHNVTTGVTRYESKEPYSYQRLWQDCIVHSGMVFNSLALREFGLYDEGLRTCEDYDLALDCASKYIFKHIAEPLVVVRIQPMNSTDSVPKEVWQQNYHTVKTRPRPRKNY